VIFLAAAFPFRTEIHGTNFSLSILARMEACFVCIEWSLPVYKSI
jgi:hypothetical protein